MYKSNQTIGYTSTQSYSGYPINRFLFTQIQTDKYITACTMYCHFIACTDDLQRGMKAWSERLQHVMDD